MEFIKDCLSRNMSLRAVAIKWSITLDNVITKYHEEREKYTDAEIEEIINDVYYKV